MTIEGADMPEAERRIAELEAVLEELCELAPLKDDGWCVRCSGSGEAIESHDPDCPWRKAVEAL